MTNLQQQQKKKKKKKKKKKVDRATTLKLPIAWKHRMPSRHTGLSRPDS
eukprot:CAMPEP_0171792188 /NCGR_PEP_ID=MMETSP0991-20121206/66802_1 /TAXON_ID=483369 /ORGANISM="non described non described, Strain CCMP2098" /LENGTH=48 /DNA_ID= /DNA_START= /DNA_END= /DNA_ORIENTATION=